MNENRNLILAIVLSAIVMLGWEYFVAGPQMQAERARQAFVHKEQAAAHMQAPKTPSLAGPGTLSRGQAVAGSGPRVAIDTPALDGSLKLKGVRFDDLNLKRYRETVDPKSPQITLLSPERTRYPYYAVFGFVGAPGANVKLP